MKLQLVKSGIEVQPYYLRIVFKNGRIFMHSETYSSKAAAKKSAKSFLRRCQNIIKLEEVKD